MKRHHQVNIIWCIILQGDRISLDRQLLNHQVTVSNIKNLLGNNESLATAYLNKCIYSVAIGSNDYLNNYFLPQFYPTSRIYNQEQYATVLVQQLSQQLLVSSTFLYLFFIFWFNQNTVVFSLKIDGEHGFSFFFFFDARLCISLVH